MFRPDELIEETCCACRIRFAVPRSFNVRCREDSSVSFYCPNGHRQHYAQQAREAEMIRRERDRLKQENARLAEEARGAAQSADAMARSARAYRGVATRMKNRIKAGVCPCCNRTFQNLAAHMKSQHPDADQIVDAALSALAGQGGEA